MKPITEPNPTHGIWYGIKLYRHIMRKFKRNPWLIADLTREQRVILLSVRRAK
jgi:hypothetical protein